MEKYRKLIISQFCALGAVGAAILGFLRYQQVHSLTDQMTLSFILFAVVLFAMEVRLVLGWIAEKKQSKV
ncbi:MAG: hypothetical protein KGQ41_00120 [Alphaproteobacteria bacterium]|nr:hypothetical protein [Alphaproteobacteria bacterium]